MSEKLSTLERIDIIRKLLDNLVEARGREKAGYISVIDDFLNHIQDDVLIKEEMIKDLQKQYDGTHSEVTDPK